MNDPAILFYTSDFLTGVIDMTMEERGKYITLLCYQHQKGHISEETIRLLLGSCSVNIMKHFIKDENGLFYNKRMDLEKEKRRNFIESRRKNGALGGRPPINNKIKPLGYAKNNLMGNENDNENINDNINKNIINYMNNILNTNYRYTTDKTKKLIQARINEGFTFEDFKIVIDKKNKDWKGTEFEKFLRPETLFGTKFESYLNQKAKKKTLNDISLDELEEL